MFGVFLKFCKIFLKLCHRIQLLCGFHCTNNAILSIIEMGNKVPSCRLIHRIQYDVWNFNCFRKKRIQTYAVLSNIQFIIQWKYVHMNRTVVVQWFCVVKLNCNIVRFVRMFKIIKAHRQNKTKILNLWNLFSSLGSCPVSFYCYELCSCRTDYWRFSD